MDTKSRTGFATASRPRSQAVALEQRILFDGAAAAAVDQQQHSDAGPAEAKDTSHPAPTASEAQTTAAAPAPRNLVVIDARVENRDQLAATLPAGTTALVVDPGQDAIAAISNALAQLGKVDSIQVYSHGASGQFTLGNQVFTRQTVEQLGDRLSAWRGELNSGADIQLYGCDVGAGSAGQALVNELARWTGADVGASSNATGSQLAGGDWRLEVTHGDIDKTIALAAATLDNFQGLLADASPTASLSGGAEVQLGEQFTFTVSFNNPSTQEGYAPFLDVFMPATGRDGDDGATFVSATYLGQVLNSFVITFDANGNATHPLAKDASGNALVINAASVGMKPGDQMVVLQLPYASVTNGQPSIDVQITGQLSNLADTSYSDGAPNLTINARAGFEYGNDSLNNPVQDPSLVESALHSFIVTPTLLKVTQTVNMPEGETVTGPNFTRTQTITVTPAPGQTLSNVTVTQTVPDQVHVSSITPGPGGTLTSVTLHDGTVLTSPIAIAAALANPNAFVASYSIHYDTLSSVSETQVGFYVPEIDANGRPVIDPATGNPVTINFGTANVTGDWNPLDPRDRPTDPDGYPFDETGNGQGVTFVAKSITLLKQVDLQTDVGTPGLTPGDTLRYTMDVAISDFFAFGENILENGQFTLTDLLSDGQTFDPSNPPTLLISQHGASQAIALVYTQTVNADGSTTLVFDIAESIRRAIAGPGVAALFGDLYGDTTQEGATRLSIVYDAQIDTTYTSDHPPHDQLNEGDSVGNNATVDATVLRDAVNLGGIQTDSSSTTSTIQTSNIDIELTQVNGGTPPGNGELRPGDVVTFTINYDLLVADYENFKLTAYLPLPLLNASGINWSFGTGVGQWTFGSGNNILDVPDSVTTGPGNSIIFDFGNFVSGGLNGGTVQVRFTMVVGDQPFADQRELDVLAQSSQTTTVDKTVLTSSDVAVIESVAEPVLDIKHGVVSSTHGTVTGTTGSWTAPGTSGVPFSGSVTSLAAVDGNVSGIDGADTLRLATALKNTGGGGAFDVSTSITLPAGLSFVGGSLSAANLQIYRGDGTLLVQGTDYNVSGNAITFLDANDQATLLAGRAGTASDLSGANVVVITYDVTVNNAILASSTLQSTASLTHYASVNGGQDFTPTDITEVANQQVAAPTLSKTYKDGSLTEDDSSATHTTGSNLVVGESITYDIVVTLPEGSTGSLRINDLIPPGLRLDPRFNGNLGYQIITTTAGSGALSADFIGALNVNPVTLDGSDGADLMLVFDSAGATADNIIGNNSFVIRLVLVASNVSSNQQGTTLNNGAQLVYSDPDGDTPNGTAPVERSVNSAQQPGVTLVEPTLSVTQQITSTPTFGGFDEGDTVTFTITVANNSGTDAFDISLLDVLPTEIDGLAISGTIQYNGGATNNGGVDFVILGGQLTTANGANIDIANGGSIVITLSGVVNATAAGEALISNNVEVRWSSLNGTSSTTDTVNGERSGDDGLLNGGQLNDYRVLSALLIPVTNGIQVSRVGGVTDTPPATNASGATDTSGLVENVVVGEIVRYRVAVLVPTGDNPNYQVRIELAAGLEFITADLNNILIAMVSSQLGGLTTDASDLVTSGSSLYMTGNQNSDVALPIHTDLGGTVPTGIFDGNNNRLEITTNPDGSQTITFNLGNVTNTEVGDSDIEGVILEFNVRVSNVAGNQANTQLGMTVFEHVGENGGVDRGKSDTVFERVVEPSFTGMDKSVIDVTPGAVAGTTDATVSVHFTQDGGVSAYNTHLADQFPNGSNYQVQSILLNGAALDLANLPSGVTFTDGSAIAVDFARLAPNDTIQVIYTVTLPNQTIADNAASSAVLTWTSLPTDFETNGWGGSVPDAAGSNEGERTSQDGASGLNNYILSDGAGMGVIQGTLWDDTRSATDNVAPDGPGLDGIDVTLSWAGDDGQFGTADDRTFTTVTANGGLYQFALLPSGSYLIAVAQNHQASANDNLRVRIDTDTGTAPVGLGSVNLTLGEGATGTADAGYVHVNEAPINTVSDQHGQEDTVLHIGGLATSDIDVNAGNTDGVMTITLTVVHGVIWQTATPPAATATPPADAGRSLVLTGTLNALNVLLSQLYYKGDQDFNTFRDSETLTMVTNDQGNFGDAPLNGDGIPGQNPSDALTDTDVMNIIIDPVNDAPIANADLANAVEAGGLNNSDPGVNPTGNVLANDTDVDIQTNNDVLTVTRVANSITPAGVVVAANGVTTLQGLYGTLSITAGGGFQYIVDNANPAVQALRTAGDFITETFGYTIVDSGGLTSSAVLQINIHGANDTPVAQGDSATAIEAGGTDNGTLGQDGTGNVLDNDTDVDSVAFGETKQVSAVRYDGPGGGRIIPLVSGQPTNVLANFGTLTINADGSYRYVIDNGNAAVQALSPGQTLVEQFTYQMADAGGLSAVNVLVITLQGANDAPVAVDDQGSAVAGASDGSSASVNASGNVITGNAGVGTDTDVDNLDQPTATQLKVDGVRSGLETTGGTLTPVANGAPAILTGTVARLADSSLISGDFGQLILNEDGSYTFEVNSADPAIRALAAGQSLEVIFTYQIHDSGGLTDQAQLVITVTGVNDPPVVNPVTVDAIEAGGVKNGQPGLDPSGSIRSAYSDPDGDSLIVSAVVNPNGVNGTPGQALAGNYGSLVLDAQGNYRYVVDNSNAAVQALRTDADQLTEVFQYSVSDGNGKIVTATFTVVIHGRNDTPVATSDAATAIEAGGTNNGTPGQDATGNVLDNDTDVDAVALGETKQVNAIRFDGTGGGQLVPVASGQATSVPASFGSLTINADGSYRYVIDNTNAAVQALSPGQTLVEQFTYQVVDTDGLTAVTVLVITIQGANDAPVAVDDQGSAIAGASDGSPAPLNASGNVITGDNGVGTDTDVDNLDQPTATQLKVDGVRSGLETTGGTLTPVANGAPATVIGTVGRLADSSLISGDFGQLILNEDGSYTFEVNSADPAIRALSVGQSLEVIFTYQIHDSGGLTDQAQLVITVTGVNDPPVVNPVTVDAIEAGGVNNGQPGLDPSGSIRGAYSDPDGDTLIVSAVVNPNGVNGTPGQALAGNYGSLVLDAQGNYRYVVDNSNAAVQALRTDADQLTEVFQYSVSDGNGKIVTATFTVVIHGRNDTPVATSDAATAIEAGGTNNGTPGQDATGNVLDNDSDVDAVALGETKQVNAIRFDGTAGGQLVPVANGQATSVPASFGSLTINADGSYRYVIDNTNAAVQALSPGQTLVEQFTYQVVDTDGLTAVTVLVITIQGANDAPVAVDDQGSAIAGASDGSPAPLNASGNVITGDNGVGTDTDVDNLDQPTATQLKVDGVRSGLETTGGTLTPVANGAPATVIGTVGRLADSSLISGDFGQLILNEDGSYTFEVNSADPAIRALSVGQSLEVIFTYQIHDSGGLTDQAQLVITVTGVNDPPVVNPVTVDAIEAGGVNNGQPGLDPSGSIRGAYSDPDGDTLIVSAVVNPNGVNGTPGQALAGNYGSLVLDAQGNYRYVVDNSNAAVQALRTDADQLTEVFQYSVSDGNGKIVTATFTVVIHGRNDTPVATSDAATAIEAGGTNNGTPGQDATGNVLDNDTDVDAVALGETKQVNAIRFDGTAGGQLVPVASGQATSVPASFGSLTINADGSYRYVIDNTNAAVQALSPGQTLVEQFTYQVVDTDGLTAVTVLVITIQGANDAPVAVDDQGSAIAGASDGSPASVNASGNVITGDNGVGADTDVDNDDQPATTQLRVNGVRSGLESAGGVLAPVASGAPASITGTVARLADSSLISGDFGQLILNEDGSYTFEVNSADPAIRALATGQSLEVIFTYQIHDSGGLTDQAQLVITVTGVNDPPVVNPVTVDAIEAGGVNNGQPGLDPSGSIRGAYSDPDGDTLIVSAVVNPNGVNGTPGQALAGNYGSLVLDAQGNYRYVVDNSNAAVQALRTDADQLTEVFQYSVSDGNGKVVTATFTVVIHGRNDTPIAADDSATAIEAGGSNNGTPGQVGSGNALSNDSDVDAGDSKAVDGIYLGTLAAGGTFIQVNAGPTVVAGTYGTLNIDANGNYVYTVNDSLAAVQALKAGEQLRETFSYRMRDTDGATAQAQINITIEGRYDTPVAHGDFAYAVAEDDDGNFGRNPTGNVLNNDTDVDANDSKVVTAVGVGAQSSNPTLDPLTGSATVTTNYGTLTLNADGSYRFVVNSNDPDIIALGPLGFVIQNYTYQVTDGGGLSDTATLTIFIRGENQPPIAGPDQGLAVEAGGVDNNIPGSDPSGNVMDNDSDPDTINILFPETLEVLAFWTGDGPLPGNASLVGQTLRGQYGDLTLNGDGTWNYVLDNSLLAVQQLRASGQTLVDNFTYLLADFWGGTANGLLTITIDGRNDYPVANDDTAVAVEAGGVNNGTAGVDPQGNVLDNDTDIDGAQYGETRTVLQYTGENGQTAAAGQVLQGLYGTLLINADGSYQYVVDNTNPTVQAMRSAGEALKEVFTYRMRDTAGIISDARLTVTVQGANDNPVARDDVNTASDQVPAPHTSGNVLPNDSDVDAGDGLTVTGIRAGQEAGTGKAGAIGQPTVGQYGTLVLNADGSYTYSIDLSNPEVLAAAGLGQVLKDYFTYTISDLAGATDQAQLVITLDISTPYIPPGPYFERDSTSGRTDAPLPEVNPAIYVAPVVERINESLTLSAWGTDGSDVRLFATPEIESPSLGSQLGLVNGQFVASAVAQSRRASAEDQNWIDGRHGVISLTADGLLPDPSLWAPVQADMVPQTERTTEPARGFRAQLREAAQRRGSNAP
ncbi:VCBS domain-containing protein [Pseudomonas sp. 10(2024)]